MSIFLKLSFILLLLSSYSSYAMVYKCEKNGVISYSDSPCKDSEKEIASKELKPAPKKPASSPTSSVKKTKKINEKLSASQEKRDVESEIKALKKQIRKNKKSLELEIQSLEKKKTYVDYGQDEYDEIQADKQFKRISQDMASARKQSSIEIENLQRKIKSLQ